VIKEALMALFAGMVIGIVFKLVKLLLPAPPVLAGVMGVAGVYFGGKLVDLFLVKLS
jgi:XapX domain-containing protein